MPPIISELFRNLIDFRSRFTAAHSSGVAASVSTIVHLFGFMATETEIMEVAGNLHALGKMAVPNRILKKPAKLTMEEFAIMRQHTYLAYSVLNTTGAFSRLPNGPRSTMNDWTGRVIRSIRMLGSSISGRELWL